MAKVRKEKDVGIRLRPSDEALVKEGDVSVTKTTPRLKAKIDSADRTVVTEDQAQTLSNKTIDSAVNTITIDADEATVSELEVDNLKVGVLETGSGVGGTELTADNTKLPSSKLVKEYVDAQILTEDEASEIVFDDTNPNVTGASVQLAVDDVANRIADHIADAVDAHDATAVSFDNTASGLTAIEVQAAIDEVEARVDTDETNLANHLADAVDAHDATAVSFNNVASGLTATEAQGAIDEVEGRLDTAETGLSDHLSDTIDAHDGTAVSFDNVASGLTATDVQAAIDEVEGRVDTAETATSDHLADAIDAHDASAISFNNVASGLTATETQAAIDEVEGRLDTAETAVTTAQSTADNHIADAIDAHDASAISNIPAGNLAATEVQAALNELQSDIDTRALGTGLSDHLSDAIDAHDASAISYVNTTSGLTATDSQAAIDEVEGRLDTAEGNITTAQSTADNHISDAVDAHDASAISNVPAGNLAATEVQSALNELQTDIDTRATDSDLTTHTGDTAAHGATGAVVGTTNTQTLTNKTLSSPSIETPTRADVKQDTFANLQVYAATASNGQLCFATDTKQMFQVIDSALAVVGGGGGGLDVFHTQTFETLNAADYDSDGLNAVFGVAGTFGGANADETSSPISDDQSGKYTAGATSTNDWFKVETIALDDKQASEDIGITGYVDSTLFSVDKELIIYDETAGAVLERLTIPGGEAKKRFSISAFIPSTTTSISYGFHMTTAPVNTESFIFDDFEFTLNPFVYKNLIEEEVFVSGAGNGGTVLTANVTDIDFTEVEDTHSAWNGTQFTAPSAGTYKFSGMFQLTTNTSVYFALWSGGTPALEKYITEGDTDAFRTFSFTHKMTKGEVVSFRQDGSVTLSNNTQRHYLQITKVLQTTEHVLTPLKNKPLVSITKSANQNIPHATQPKVTFNTVLKDGEGVFDDANDRFVIQADGDYQIFGVIGFAGTAAANAESVIEVYKNGTFYKTLGSESESSSSINSDLSFIAAIENAVVNDYFEIFAYHENDSTSDRNILATRTHVSLKKLDQDATAATPFNYVQTKLLTADVTTDTTISDLTFNNLEIGKTYRVGGRIQFESTVNSFMTVLISNGGGNTVDQVRWVPNGGTQNLNGMAINAVFTATTSTLSFISVNMDASESINGDNSRGETWVQLEELNYTKETTKFS